jgi:hypothetical protein
MMNDRPGTGFGAAVGAAALAALAAAASLILVYAANPGFWPPLHLVPSLGSGFYPVEHNESGGFAWMGEAASVNLPGLDRRVAWACDIRVKAGRPVVVNRPTLTIAADEETVAIAAVPDEPAHVTFTVPARQERRGVSLTFTPSETFTPVTDDPRRLGLVVEDLACRPAAGIPLPPRGALGRAALAGTFLGAGFGLLQVTPGTAVGAAVAVAALQAIPLALGMAPFLVLGTAAPWLALVVAVLLVAGVRLTALVRRMPLRNTGKFVAGFTAASVYLKLLVLLHPEAAPATPGAPALAVFFDHRAPDVVLLCLNGLVGLLLYWLGCKLLGDRLAAAGAVVLYHLVPGSFWPGLASGSSTLAAPVVALAITGALRLAVQPGGRPALLLLAAWASSALAARAWVGGGPWNPLTIYPPLALAAATGASWGWSAGRLGPRVATSVVLSGALWAAAVAWLSAL